MIGSQTSVRIDKWNFNGIYIIANASASVFDITVTFPRNFDTWNNQYQKLGVTQTTVPNSGGEDSPLRPTTNAYFAGRAWYAGTPANVLGQHVLFSQIIEKDAQYGRCFQSNDPTSEQAPDLVESDFVDCEMPAQEVDRRVPIAPRVGEHHRHHSARILRGAEILGNLFAASPACPRALLFDDVSHEPALIPVVALGARHVDPVPAVASHVPDDESTKISR